MWLLRRVIMFAAWLEIIHFYIVFVFSLTLLLFQDTINVTLRNSWVLQYATKQNHEVQENTELAPKSMIGIGILAHLNHKIKVTEYYSGENEEENCEWPWRSQRQDGAPPTIATGEKDAVDLANPHILRRVRFADLVLFLFLWACLFLAILVFFCDMGLFFL